MVNELFKQTVVRAVKELMFNNELTYRKSLYENFDYKSLMMSHINKERVVNSVNEIFQSTFQFEQQFGSYTPLGFVDGLKHCYNDFKQFHLNEISQEQ